MIKFRSFLQVIHESARSAVEVVESQGQEHIKKFFNVVQSEDKDGVPNYEPKCIDMEFPNRTDKGVEVLTVKVPLITLTPISTPRISEICFSTELEVTTDGNDDLVISFPRAKKSGVLFGKSESASSSNTKIDIKLTGREPPEGLQKIIDGYERALRAQIPG